MNSTYIIHYNDSIYIEYTIVIITFLILLFSNLLIIFCLTVSLRNEFQRANTLYFKYMNLKFNKDV